MGLVLGLGLNLDYTFFFNLNFEPSPSTENPRTFFFNMKVEPFPLLIFSMYRKLEHESQQLILFMYRHIKWNVVHLKLHWVMIFYI